MKKKLFFGVISLASIAAVFIACGQGTVDPFGPQDDIAVIALSTTLNPSTSLEACEADLECSALLNQVTVPLSSSAYIPPPSSSSEDPFIPVSSSSVAPLSSSSLIIIAPSSSSIVPPSSSSIVEGISSSVVPGGALAGTCAPTPAIADLGQTVTWTFSKAASVPVQEIIKATFDWVFEGGSLGEFSGVGAAAISKSLTYSVSGPHTTTLSTNEAAPITCTPVQINGAKITGCACTVDKASPDVAAGGISTWTVAGCLSTANITGYTWNAGTLGEELTFSHTFAAKDETFKPTLTVSNDDNTVQTVVCPAAKAIDASLPDYELTAQNTKILLPAGPSTLVMNLPANWHGTTTGTCTFSCNGGQNITGTIDGVALAGSYYATASIPIMSTINGYAIPVILGAAMECQVGW